MIIIIIKKKVARHLYGYTKVLDGDGDPNRPDNYSTAV
jgi:hypothetical protein